MVTLILPTLDEEAYLPATLEALLPQARAEGAEVLVVDGGSGDRTRDVACARAGVGVIEAGRGRGRQMNAGARAARGSLLAFVPADTLLPPGAVAALAEVDARGRPEAGGFRQRFDRGGIGLATISRLHNLRARLTGVMYGDQVPFVRAELFRDLGGYREDRDLEDVELGTRLRRITRPRLLPLAVTTSARRFVRHGVARATWDAAWILFAWTFLRRVRSSRTFFDPVR